MVPEEEEDEEEGQGQVLQGDEEAEEGLDDEGEEERETSGRSAGGPGSVAPPLPLIPGTRLPNPTPPPRSAPLVPYGRKTRDLPNLCICHGCGLRFPDRGRRERLQPLDSQWRIVLLCKACLRDVRSAQVCSYCFVNFRERDAGFVNCRECSCRVHIGCLPEQRGYLAPSDLDPGLFTCVDCRAIPIPRTGKRGKLRGSSVAGVSSLSLDNVLEKHAKVVAGVKSVDVATPAKEKALAKAAAAKHAVDMARGALDSVLAEKLPGCAAVPDEELALQLHLAMNGSQRRSRNSCPANSCRLINDERGWSNTSSLDKESGNCSICGELELCPENTFLQTVEIIDVKPLNVIGACEGDFLVNSDTRPEKCQCKEVILHSKGDAAEMPAREEHANCSDHLVNSTGVNNNVDGLPASCPRPGGLNTIMSQQDEKCSMPDRFLKKYYKRSSRMKDR